MRDFHDAKAMARTLRAALAARGFKISNSQSLELVAEMFGIANWNTLAAAIRREEQIAHKSASSPPLSSVASDPRLPFSANFVVTLHRALDYANQRKHEYATLEHHLLALIDDADGAAVMSACNVDSRALRTNLVSYLNNALRRIEVDDGRDSKLTAAFQRVIQRAALHVQSSGTSEITGANVLVALFSERMSPAVSFLQEQNMSRLDAVNAITQGTGRGTGDAASA